MLSFFLFYTVTQRSLLIWLKVQKNEIDILHAGTWWLLQHKDFLNTFYNMRIAVFLRQHIFDQFNLPCVYILSMSPPTEFILFDFEKNTQLASACNRCPWINVIIHLDKYCVVGYIQPCPCNSAVPCLDTGWKRWL